MELVKTIVKKFVPVLVVGAALGCGSHSKTPELSAAETNGLLGEFEHCWRFDCVSYNVRPDGTYTARNEGEIMTTYSSGTWKIDTDGCLLMQSDMPRVEFPTPPYTPEESAAITTPYHWCLRNGKTLWVPKNGEAVIYEKITSTSSARSRRKGESRGFVESKVCNVGERLGDTKVVDIGEVLENAESFQDIRVRVRGQLRLFFEWAHVCFHDACIAIGALPDGPKADLDCQGEFVELEGTVVMTPQGRGGKKQPAIVKITDVREVQPSPKNE